MAKKTCELCSVNMSTDTLFGIALCDECRALYSAVSKGEASAVNKVKDPGFAQRASEQAKKMFLSKATQFSPELLKQREKAENEKREREEERRELERREQEDRDSFLKENGHEGYYEYKIISIIDDRTGSIDLIKISHELNELGRQGWHLSCAYTNEIGKNTTSVGFGGVASGVNSTVEQSILILERFIKFK